jgi:hypothetical protein
MPAISAVATTMMNGSDFASMLDRAIARNGKAQAICEIDLAYEETDPGTQPNTPRSIERRSISVR